MSDASRANDEESLLQLAKWRAHLPFSSSLGWFLFIDMSKCRHGVTIASTSAKTRYFPVKDRGLEFQDCLSAQDEG